MQKKLIALAVAGLSSAAAFAQSNVTVYGIAGDVYYGRATADGMGARPPSTAVACPVPVSASRAWKTWATA